MLRATCPSAHAPSCRNAYPRDLPSAHASEPVCPAYFRARTRSEAQHPRLHQNQNVGWGSRPGTTEMKPPGGLERPACAHASGSAEWRALQLSVPTHSPVSSVPSLPRADLCEFPSPRERSRQRQSRGIIATFLPSRVAPHCEPCRVETRYPLRGKQGDRKALGWGRHGGKCGARVSQASVKRKGS